MEKPKFKGWDWGELCDPLEVPYVWDTQTTDDLVLKALQDRIYKASADEDREVMEICKEFLRALMQYPESCNPIYEGMIKVDDCVTFFSWFARNLEVMWT